MQKRAAGVRIIMIVISIIIIFAKACFAIEDIERFDLKASIQRDFLKSDDSNIQKDTVNLWSDFRYSLSNWHLFLYPVFKYNSIDKKGEVKFRRNYTTINMDNLYIGFGKQPIIWGVGRGRNPTNYLMQLQLFEKQEELEIALKGIESILVDYSPEKYTIEAVAASAASDEKDRRFAMRAKTFCLNTDMSISFFKKGKEFKTGGDFETDIQEMFGFYGEASGKNMNNWEGLAGVDRTITFLNKSSVNLEYYYSKIDELKQREMEFQLILSPTDETSVNSSFSHNIDKKINMWMTRLSYNIGKCEFVLVSIFKSDHGIKDTSDFPFERIISIKVIGYLF